MLSLIWERLAHLFRVRVAIGQELLLLALVAIAAAVWIQSRTPVSTALTPLEARTSLGLQELVQSLKTELEQMESQRLSEKRGALFRVKDFDLELSFVLKHNSKDSAKLEYEILTAEMQRELGNEQTHKITLHMEVAPPTIAQFPPSTKPIPSDDAVQLPFVPKAKGVKR